jgi:hypothetical protein
LEILARAIWQEVEIKGIQIGKQITLSLVTEYMILYLKNLKNFTKNLLDTISSFSKEAGYNVNL